MTVWYSASSLDRRRQRLRPRVGRLPAQLGFEHDVGLVLVEPAAEAVVAPHRVLQEPEVPARQAVDAGARGPSRR